MARRYPETSMFRRSPACALAVVTALIVGPCADPRALAQGQISGQDRSRAKVRELVIPAPPLTRRCRRLEVRTRPADLADLEARVTAWMATCVTSRTEGARREVALVHDNRSLAELWAAWPAGAGVVQIIPHYTRSGERITRVDFRSPDIGRKKPAAAGARAPARPATPGSSPSTSAAVSRSPGSPSVKKPPAAQPIDPMLPDDATDILLDVRALIERMREQGLSDDADKLERLAKEAAKWLVSLSLLVGAYYVGTRWRAGKLLFMWGSGALRPEFRQVLGRLQRLLPDVERALDTLVDAARPHVPGAGAGLDWRVLDQIVDPSVPAQLDSAACGPACAQMVLEGRKLDIPQSELISRARAMLHPELKSKFVSGDNMRALLQDVDPGGGWVGGELEDEFLHGKTWRQLLDELGAKGSWIAQVGKHFVVVDRFDSRTGSLFIRDPWYEPARERGIAAGTHYRVSARTFFDHWLAVAIYRK